MGKNNKVLLDNGKEASSSMQLYWNKAKQIEKKKQELRKQDMKERRQQEMSSKQVNQKQGGGNDDDDDDNKAFMSKEAMSNIMKEKERRRQGQYASNSDNVITEAHILNAQKAMTSKAIKIPGYSTEFITSQQVERNKKEMEKRKAFAQVARERKELREKQESEGGKQGQEQQPNPLVQGDQKQQLPPHLANKPPFNPHQQPYQNKPPYQNQYRHHNKHIDQEKNDPFFKVTEKEDYNPVEERQKQLQNQQQQFQNQQNASYPPPPPNMPPPPLIQGQMPFYPPQYQNPYMQQSGYGAPTPTPPPPLVAQPVVVEGESTVKKSKIDLTQKKQLFVPRGVLSNPGVNTAQNIIEKKLNQQPEALGGNIQNVSQAPAPKPFLSGGANPIISNPNNQDLLKQFFSDIESISKISKND